MKIKFLSAFNENFKELHDISKISIEKFCINQGFSFEFYKIENFDRPAAWYKIKLIIEELKLNDGYIIWMDCDSMILNSNFDILKHIDNLNLFYIGSDFNGINTGFMIIKCCQQMIDFFEKVWSMTEYLEHCWWEQAAIRNLYESNYQNCVEYSKILDQNIFNSYPMQFFGYENNAEGSISNQSFTCHFPSLPLQLRIQLMREYLNCLT